jgi:hypothetical protein
MSKTAPGRRVYLWFFMAVAALFLGILAYTWIQSERARPVILDEKGQIPR